MDIPIHSNLTRNKFSRISCKSWRSTNPSIVYSKRYRNHIKWRNFRWNVQIFILDNKTIKTFKYYIKIEKRTPARDSTKRIVITWNKFAVRFISTREYIETSIAIVETPKSLIKRVDGFKLLIRKFASRATRREMFSSYFEGVNTLALEKSTRKSDEKDRERKMRSTSVEDIDHETFAWKFLAGWQKRSLLAIFLFDRKLGFGVPF